MSRVLYTKERWEQVNEVNKQLMKQYLRACKGDRKGERTINEYGYDLRFFLCWNLLYNNNMSVLDFKKRHFDEFKYFMGEERNASPARVNRLLSAIRTMMGFAQDDDDEYEDYMINPASRIKGLEKEPIREITFLSQRQIDLLRDYLAQHKMYQHLCLLDILYDTGARVNEVFQVSNTETLDKGYLKVKCKGGREEYILLHSHAKESIKLHLSVKKEGEAFWQSKYGPARGSQTLRGWVSTMCNILKRLDPSAPHFTPHTFRHSFLENTTNGTHYLCQIIGRKFTMEEAQLLAHHKSIDMTKSYLKPKDDELIFGLFGIKIN
ncbi:MAG: integrase [Clostridium lundense]|nr:integrase [Clostridium lundense]